jgi:hypothetical protein
VYAADDPADAVRRLRQRAEAVVAGG